MTKSQAGIAMVVVVLLAAGAGGVCFHYLWPGRSTATAPQIPPGSPRSVVYDLLKGMQEGDGDLIRHALYARDANETEAATALVEYSTAASRLTRLGDTAFGFGRLTPPGLPLARTNLDGQVARLNEIVDDDLADVDLNPSVNPSIFHLRKIDGRWWVMLRQTFEPSRSDESGPLTELVESLRAQAKVFSQVSTGIESGRITTLEQAQVAMNRQLAEVFRTSWYGSIWYRNATTMPVVTPAPPPAMP